MYYGPVNLGTTDFALFCQVTEVRTPHIADSNALSYRIYGPNSDTPLLTGTYSITIVDSQTGFYTAQGVALTVGNGFAAGNVYIIRTTYAINAGTQQVQVDTVTVV